MHNQQLRQRIQIEDSPRATFRTGPWNRDSLQLAPSHHEDAFGFLSSNHRHDEVVAQALPECDQVEEGSSPTFVCDQLDDRKDRM